jgi:hypothetical protein
VARVKAVTGRVDLVHCNNSRDEFGSGRDRHAGMESGQIDPVVLVSVVKEARGDRDLRDTRRSCRYALAAGRTRLARPGARAGASAAPAR